MEQISIWKDSIGLWSQVIRNEPALVPRAYYNRGQAFYEKGLYKTRGNTGVLFFLSLYERKVRVLADKGIYEKIHQDMIEHFAKAVSQGMKEGRGCEALCEAVREAGQLLSKHFPLEPGDTNELSNKVIFK